MYDADNPDWAPSVNMGLKRPPLVLSPDVASDRFKRRKDRHLKPDAAHTLMLLQGGNSDSVLSRDSDEHQQPEDQGTEIGTQTDVNFDLLSAMQSELQLLRSENISLKNRLSYSSCYSMDSFAGNDEKVFYWIVVFSGFNDALYLS